MGISNTQYNEIMKQYEKRRDISRHQLEKRVAYVSEHIGGFKETEEEIASISVMTAKKYLSGDENALNELSDLLNEKIEHKKALLTDAGYGEDYLNPSYECPDCHDTGYIGQNKCHCFKQAIINLLYQQSGITEMLEKENFAHLDYGYYHGKDLENFKKAVAKCHLFCENTAYQNLCFYGTVGTGKSFLSACIAKNMIEQGLSVIYYSATDFFKKISRQMFERDKEEATMVHEDLSTCDLLIIDDLGTEKMSDFTISQLFSCLNSRHLNQKATVISTNLSFEQLLDRYTERIFSRIYSNYEHLLLTGTDIRMVKKQKTLKSI
ncbi:MAG: ATP-binding protein [Lachnospiraceae bacterium]|nr:ATP-binding protein [Lachnospiraceae bacterium]